MVEPSKEIVKEEKFSWPPLEGDPEIFTKYLKSVGFEKGNFNEVFSFEKEMLSFLPNNALAVIMAFRRKEKTIGDQMIPTNANFFMFQKHDLDNACGIIACLHAVFNNLDRFPLQANSPLANLWKLVADQSPTKCSEIVSNFQPLKKAHKSFSSQGQSAMPKSQEGVKYHFVCFTVNKAMQLVYLDGCKESPLIVKSNVKEEDLVLETIEVIKSLLADNKIHDNLSVMTLNSEI